VVVSDAQSREGSERRSYGGGILHGRDRNLVLETGGVVAGFEEPGSVLIVGVDMMAVWWRVFNGV
jgi:hypothetical protein